MEEAKRVHQRFRLHCLLLVDRQLMFQTPNLVEFKDATMQPWCADPIAFAIAGIECANIKDARNVLRVQQGFVSLMVVVVVVLILAVTREPVTNSFVQPMVAVRGANLKGVASRQWEDLIYALLMVVVVDVQWKDVISRHSLRQSSASSTEVERNVPLMGVKRYHVDVLNSVQLMAVVFAASWQVAIGLRLGKYNFVELMGVELVRSRKHLKHSHPEKYVYR